MKLDRVTQRACLDSIAEIDKLSLSHRELCLDSQLLMNRLVANWT
jgi:hypothetical protein